MEGKVVGKIYKLKRKIGEGSFGKIFVAENTRTHKTVAVKLEPLLSGAQQLEFESKLYSIMTGGPGIPHMRWFGRDTENHVLVLDLLGKSLEDLLDECGRSLSLKTVLMIADQVLSSVEFIHSKGFIHRDIKPDNILMGRDKEANHIFFIDFGLAKKYRDPATHAHIKYSEGKSLTGTARYASIHALKGYEQSRRDDMESIAYALIYLLKGSLPWMGIKAGDISDKCKRICELKSMTREETLCFGLPNEFAEFLRDVKKLKFSETPDYAKYRRMFRELFLKSEYLYDYKYDWCPSYQIGRARGPPKPAASPAKGKPKDDEPMKLGVSRTQHIFRIENVKKDAHKPCDESMVPQGQASKVADLMKDTDKIVLKLMDESDHTLSGSDSDEDGPKSDTGSEDEKEEVKEPAKRELPLVPVGRKLTKSANVTRSLQKFTTKPPSIPSKLMPRQAGKMKTVMRASMH